MQIIVSLCEIPHTPATYLLLCPKIFSNLFSNTSDCRNSKEISKIMNHVEYNHNNKTAKLSLTFCRRWHILHITCNYLHHKYLENNKHSKLIYPHLCGTFDAIFRPERRFSFSSFQLETRNFGAIQHIAIQKTFEL